MNFWMMNQGELVTLNLTFRDKFENKWFILKMGVRQSICIANLARVDDAKKEKKVAKENMLRWMRGHKKR